MQTVRLTDDKKGIDTAAEILKAGGVVAIPTETVYGLAASAFNNDAIGKVFVAKGRPQDNPLIVHICDMDMLDLVASEVSETAKKLANAFWPGPFTMILPKSPTLADSVSKGLDTVAVRMPSNEVALRVIKASELPLAAPSANLSGSPSPTSYNHVLDDLDGRIDAVICSDDAEVGVESTVVSLATNPPRLLRPGAVTKEELTKFLPDLVVDKAVLSEPEKDEAVASPGMKYTHYSPKTDVFLVEGDSDSFAEFVNMKENCVTICFSEDTEKLKCKCLCYGEQENPAKQAKAIFALLRKTDELGANAVYIHAPEKKGIGLAVYNRLIRAAGFKVIQL